MTVTSGFFNSVAGDRVYDAEDFGRVFGGMIEDGIFKGVGVEFQVSAATGLTLSVGAGRAFFNNVWVNNDDVEGLVASASHSGLPRIDAVVLAVDTSDAVRNVVVRFKVGTAASTPTPPSMTRTATLNEYPLAYISRAPGSTSVTNANITPLVGTPSCPYAVSRLLDRSFDNPVGHRRTFRGKNLGSSFTSAQKLAIKQGTFEDIFLGDYWQVNGVNWRVVDIDYFYNQGQPSTLQHHVTIMPDTALGWGTMNDNFYAANASGYKGTTARTRLTPMRNQAVAIFGEAHFLFHEILMTTQVTNGKPSQAEWTVCSFELPSVGMIFGTNSLQLGGDGSNYPPAQHSESLRQLSLFDIAPWFIKTAPNPAIGGDQTVSAASWLRDVISPVMWPCIGMRGELSYGASTNPYYYRPYFSIVG